VKRRADRPLARATCQGRSLRPLAPANPRRQTVETVLVYGPDRSGRRLAVGPCGSKESGAAAR